MNLIKDVWMNKEHLLILFQACKNPYKNRYCNLFPFDTNLVTILINLFYGDYYEKLYRFSHGFLVILTSD